MAIGSEVPEMRYLYPNSLMAIRIQPFTYTDIDYFGTLVLRHGHLHVLNLSNLAFGNRIFII